MKKVKALPQYIPQISLFANWRGNGYKGRVEMYGVPGPRTPTGGKRIFQKKNRGRRLLFEKKEGGEEIFRDKSPENLKNQNLIFFKKIHF